MGKKKLKKSEEIINFDELVADDFTDVMGTEVVTGATYVLRSAWDVENLANLLNVGEGEGEPTLVSEEPDDYDGAVVKVLWTFRIHDTGSLECLTQYAEDVSEFGEFEIIDD